MDWKQIWLVLRKYVLNKYVLTILVFAAVFLFVGEQSLIKDMKRSRQIRQTEQELRASETAIREARHKMQILQQPDSLEKFAREQYLMHTDSEDVYLVEEVYD